MKSVIYSALAIILAFSIAPSAQACRWYVPDRDRLAEYDTIVLVTITHAERLETPGWNNWRLSAVGIRNVVGSAENTSYEFTSGLSSNGCQAVLPSSGERWILYLDQLGSGDVLEAFPLGYAKDYDSRLADVR